jgi:hypothetical protein
LISVLPLRFLPGNKWVLIRELRGKDELSVCGKQSIDAILLLDQIFQDIPGINQVVSHAATLPVPDRDRILLAVYYNTYGSKVETTVTCQLCGKKFDLSFSLNEWLNDLNSSKKTFFNGKEGDFPFETHEGIKFRLPTGSDEMAIMGMSPEIAETELLKRCIAEVPVNFNIDELLRGVEEIAPLVDEDIDAECPECLGKQILHFNLQQYILSSLMAEHDNLVAEVNLLTRSYGWRLKEILELPRRTRQSYVELSVNQ